MKLSERMNMPSGTLEEWIEEVAQLEDDVGEWKRLATFGLYLYRQTRFVYGDDPIATNKRVEEIQGPAKAKEK